MKLRIIFVLILSLALSACAGTSPLKPYKASMQIVYTDTSCKVEQ